MRSLDPTSKISSIGHGLDRVLSSNFIVIKIRMVVPRTVAGIPSASLGGSSAENSDSVPLERRILFSLN